MNCRAAERRIFAERDGALDETQRAELATHVATCAACRSVREGLTTAAATWRGDTARVSVPNAELEWQKVRRQIRGAPTTSTKLTWIGLPLAGAAAAAAIGIYLGTGTPPPSAKIDATTVQAAPAVAAATPAQPSTVVYVDEKSGWTFVVAADDSGQHI